MPLHLMGDRGELISRQAEALSEGFNIDVENAPPYNGAAKGVVERTFGTKQTRFGPYLPGYVDKEFLGRDADPPALSAALDLDQVTKVFLASSIIHNHHVLNPRPYYMTSWTTWVGLALLSVGTLIGSCVITVHPPLLAKLKMLPSADSRRSAAVRCCADDCLDCQAPRSAHRAAHTR
jgi:hypothetical protein